MPAVGFALLAAVAFVAILWVAAERRRRGGRGAPRGWVAAALVLSVGSWAFFFPPVGPWALDVARSWLGAEIADRKDYGPPELVAEVVGRQFVWYVRYPGRDGRFGRRREALVDSILNPLGLDPGDAAGADDVVVRDRTLRVRRDLRVRVRVTSDDVLHRVAVPGLRFGADAVPGEVREFVLPAAPAGEYPIFCAAVCGLGHYRMRGRVLVLDDAAHFEWASAAGVRP